MLLLSGYCVVDVGMLCCCLLDTVRLLFGYCGVDVRILLWCCRKHTALMAIGYCLCCCRLDTVSLLLDTVLLPLGYRDFPLLGLTVVLFPLGGYFVVAVSILCYCG